ncbi:hypothetical protein FSP39_004416 [Pinctada imbricata]|uniref:SPARC-related modular calcium-binding protein 1 n=1 Tax=Pinctada imbricata TaxID=66713 RepID=A0AA88XVF4_PINIB|nr:hypothetical protein FSP39_004416 [Pinctada imbricata]
MIWYLVEHVCFRNGHSLCVCHLFQTLFRSLRNSECNIDCSVKKYRPVCGSDGITYSHRCYLKRAKRCDRKRVKVVSKGQCSPSSRPSTGCLKERDDAVRLARKPTLGVFIPECDRDGTYSDVQCHSATGYCWCVTSDGKPIRGTSMQGKKPNCRGKPKQRKSRGKKKGKRRKKRRCRTADRQQFNNNLIKVFKDEYFRDVQVSSSHSVSSGMNDPVLNSLNKRVVEWKFSKLDMNNDNKLRKKETRILKKMVKKVIKPRACAKTFIGYCDLDNNKKIERKEWTLCLGVDINRDKSTHATPEPQQSEDTPNLTDRLTMFEPSRRGPVGVPGGLIPRPSDPPNIKPPMDDKTRDCIEERKNALLQHQQDPDGKTYIPRCTVLGKWDKAQCHESSQYCWCVEEETGKPIPGTSTHKVMPKCDQITDRQMKGCPLGKKRKFLKEMISKMLEDMRMYKQNGSDLSKLPSGSSGMSEQEVAVRWKLNILDVNSNSKIDKREMKPLRRELPKKKDTRKCRRNFIRYCDADNDKKITSDEWIDCMGIKNNILPLPDNPNRRGPNPFDQYLRPS